MYKTKNTGYGVVLSGAEKDVVNEAIKENMDTMANMLSTDIKISRQIAGNGGIPGMVYSVLLNPGVEFRLAGKQREKLILFGKQGDPNLSKNIKTVESCRKVLKMYSHNISDHAFTIKQVDANKIVGYGMSPYFNPNIACTEYALEDIRKNLEAIMEALNPQATSLYDIQVLGLDESVYYPGKTITILFLKK